MATVHEYGGGALTASCGTLYASNAANNAIYEISRDGVIRQLTDVNGARFLVESGLVRQAKHIIDSLKRETAFYLEVFDKE